MLLKRSIAIVLTFVLSLQPLMAATEFWDSLSVSNLQDNTSGLSSFKDANGREVYSFGGSLVIKRDQPKYPLWWKFQAPEIKASCSGISFKGMFGSIVNIGELAEQFEEAGASAAWGIMVAVIYSLPGIGEVFTKLDAWAKKIQSMLANSCQAGMALGKELAGEAKESAMATIDAGYADETGWIAKTGKTLGDFDKSINDALDCTSTLWSHMGSGTDCEAIKKGLRSSLGSSYIASPSITGSTLFSIYEETKVFPVALSGENKIEEEDWTAYSPPSGLGDRIHQELAFTSLIVSASGEVAMPLDLARSMANAMKLILDDTADKTQRESAMKGLSAAIKGSEGAMCKEQPSTLSPKLVARFLLYGNGVNESTVIDDDDNESTALPTSGPATSEAVINHAYLPMMMVYKAKDHGSVKGRYSTVAMEALTPGSKMSDGISDKLRNYQGVIGVAEDMKSCYLFGEESSCAKVKFSLVNASTARFMAKVYKNTADKSMRARLEEGFVKFVAYHLMQAIIAKVNEHISRYQTNIKAYAAADLPTASGQSIDAEKVVPTVRGCMSTVRQGMEDFRTVLDKEVDDFYDTPENSKLKESGGVYLLYLEQNKKNMKQALEQYKR